MRCNRLTVAFIIWLQEDSFAFTIQEYLVNDYHCANCPIKKGSLIIDNLMIEHLPY